MSEERFFSDRELGQTPARADEVSAALWAGIVAQFDRSLDRHLFAKSFPEQCPDGGAVSGTSVANLRATLGALIPDIADLPRVDRHPGTLAAMDLVEFCWEHAAEATPGEYHSFFRHHELTFDVVVGRHEWRRNINRLLERNGCALTLREDGRAERILPSSLSELVEGRARWLDGSLDAIVADACKRISSPSDVKRLDALEKIWDAFERAKTVLDRDKKSGARSLIESITSSEHGRDFLEAEMRRLTTVGNTWRIRHHETNKLEVPSELVDYLFGSALSILDLAGKSITDD